MPIFAVPVVISTEVIISAASKEEAEDMVRATAVSLYPSEETKITTEVPTCKSAYEVTVTFYLNAFTTYEAEDIVCTAIRDGVKDDISIGYDVENTKKGEPCRG